MYQPSDVVSLDEDTKPLAALVHERLVSDIDQAILEGAIAAHPDPQRHLFSHVGLPCFVNFVQDVQVALLLQLWKGLPHRSIDKRAMPCQVPISLIGDVVEVLGT